MTRSARWFWTVIALQVGFLLAWAGYHEIVRSHAPTILLRTRPVDPRDLLRGDYLVLAYDITGAKLPDAAKLGEYATRGESYWVVLEKKGRYHEAVSVSREEPVLSPGQIAVRADSNGRGLQYGIEQFYVPEGTGTPRFKTLEVEAAVSPTHRLYIKRILVDGKNYPAQEH